MNKNLYSVFKSLYLVSFEGCRSGLAERIYGAPYRHFSPYSRFPWRIKSFLRLHDKNTIRSQSIYLLPHIPLYCLFLQTYFITEQKILNKTSIPVSSLGKKMDLVGLKKFTMFDETERFPLSEFYKGKTRTCTKNIVIIYLWLFPSLFYLC